MVRSFPAVLAAVALTFLAACGGDDAAVGTTAATSADTTVADAVVPDSTAASETTAVTETTTAATQTTDGQDVVLDADAPDLGRVVALAEEFMLADLLTLGIEPIASSASVDTVGFQGLDEFDTSAIEVLPMTTLSLEYLATLQADTIITLQFWVDQVGAGVLEGMANVIIVPDGLSGPEGLATLGELVGRPQHAAKAAAEYETALATARARVGDGCKVSLAAIYPGPSVAAFVAGPWELPTSVLATGCVLDPSAADAAPDSNGRVWLSLEQLGLLDSETLILLQSDTVEGETAAVAEIEANSLWQTLPAVAADQVIVFDRLGYPGLAGQIRFLDEFSALMD